MSAEDKFQQLWQSRKAVLAPSKEELMHKAINVKTSVRRQLIRASILLILTVAWIVFILSSAKPAMPTTWVGIAMLFAGILLFLFSSAGMIKSLNPHTHTDLPVFDYLQHMLQIREKQRFLQNTIAKTYLGLQAMGICLYLIEFTRQFSIPVQILIYVVTLGWIALSWFVMGKKMIKKQETAISGVIEKLQSLIDEKEKGL